MNVRGIASILFLSLLLTNCSGSSGGGNNGIVAATTTPATATATEASIFGTADKISVAITKPDQKTETVKAAASPLAGAAVTAIKSDGTSAGSTTTALDGTYTLLLPKGGTYVIKITSGNIVMKSVYTVGTADATINVNPGTTAAVMILEKKLSTTFDSGTVFSAAITNVNVNATVTAIAATSGFTATANAVVTAVANNTNPLTDTTVAAAATTAAATAATVSSVGSKFAIATTATVAGSATGAGQEVAVSAAYDGTNYLVGINGDATARYNGGAQLIDGSGAKVGSLISTGRTGGTPIVGFSGTYLIAWEDDALNTGTTWNEITYGQVINTAGTASGAPFAIGPASNSRLSAGSVFCKTGKCGVLWSDDNTKAVYARVDIDSAGAFTSALVTIESGTAGGAPGGVPGAAYDAGNCMAVYDNGATVRGSIATATTTFTSSFTIATKAPVTAGCTASNPARAAFDGTNYLVVWNDHSDCAAKPSWDILAQRVDASGTKVGSAFQVNSTSTKYAPFPTIAFDGTNFLVIWTDGRNDANKDNVCGATEGTCTDIYGQYISKAGALVGSEFVINNDAGEQFGFMAGFNAGKYLVLINTGVDFSTGAFGDVYGVFVTP